MSAAQMGESAAPKTAAALCFVVRVVGERAPVNEADVQALRDEGFDDEAIFEILAHTARNVFTNYVNVALATPLDFAAVKPRRAA
jgi:alkylhydroperoxidase family enzyme